MYLIDFGFTPDLFVLLTTVHSVFLSSQVSEYIYIYIILNNVVNLAIHFAVSFWGELKILSSNNSLQFSKIVEIFPEYTESVKNVKEWIPEWNLFSNSSIVGILRFIFTMRKANTSLLCSSSFYYPCLSLILLRFDRLWNKWAF